MSFTITGGVLLTKAVKITGTSATNILSATQRTNVLSLVCTEIAGATPNLTVELYDTANTTSYYVRFEKAMTAKETYVFNEFLVVPANWVLRVTSSAADQIDVIVNYMGPDATGL